MTTPFRQFARSGLLSLVLCFGIASLLPAGTAVAQPLVLEIQKAEAAVDSRTKEPIVTIVLTKESARRFHELSVNNIGRVFELRIDGRVVMRPVIREPILGPRFQISGKFTAAEAKDMAERLSKGAKIEVEIVAK